MNCTVSGFVRHNHAPVAFTLVANNRRHIFLSGTHVEVQVGHIDFEHDKDKSPGFSAIVSRSEGAFLYGCSGPHHLVFYFDDVREGLAKTLTMPPDYVFIGHGYLQHTGGEWQQEYCLL